MARLAVVELLSDLESPSQELAQQLQPEQALPLVLVLPQPEQALPLVLVLPQPEQVLPLVLVLPPLVQQEQALPQPEQVL
jgi:hypothetical protein